MMTGDYWERIAAFLNDRLREHGAPGNVFVQGDPYEARDMLAVFMTSTGTTRETMRRALLQYDVILHDEDMPPDPDGPEDRKTKRR